MARIGEICFLFSFLSFFFSLPFFLVNLIFSICLFIEVWLIYLMMLVSGAQRSGSVLLQIMLHLGCYKVMATLPFAVSLLLISFMDSSLHSLIPYP